MTDLRIWKLLERLYSLTVNESLEWELVRPDIFALGREPEAVRAQLGRYAVVVQPTPDPENPQDPDYQFEIFGETGLKIEGFSNIDLAAQPDRHIAQGVTAYGAMKEIYRLARRRAVGADKALDEILDFLDEPKNGH